MTFMSMGCTVERALKGQDNCHSIPVSVKLLHAGFKMTVYFEVFELLAFK